MTRFYETLKEVNHVLIHATSEDGLLEAICQVMVEVGGYPLVWIGFAEQDAQKSVRLAAWKGEHGEYLDGLQLSWGENEYGRGPTGRAIRNGHRVIVHDIPADPVYDKRREQAVKAGFVACIALPLVVNQAVIGAFNLYANDAFAFEELEVGFLEDLASGIAYGITNQRRMSALSQSEARFRLLAENARDLIYRYALLPEPHFEYVSPSATQITGYTPDDHYNDPNLAYKLVYPDDISLLDKIRESSMPLTLRWIKKDGAIIWTEQHNTCIYNEQGDIIAIEGIARDVTHHYRTARLAVAGEIATGVAHQINNPLTTVIIESHLLLKQLETGSPLHHTVQDIKEAAYRAANVVQRLLNLGRMQADVMHPLDVNLSLYRAIELLRPQMMFTEIQTDFHDKLPMIYGSEDYLQDVWMNLLLNAKEAVAMRNTKLILIQTAWEGDKVRVTIQDEGIGISEDTIAHIFDPFFTTKTQGTGLGLSICQDIILRHQGQIQVSSIEGEGTTFALYFPILTDEE